MEFSLLTDIVIVLGMSVIVLLLTNRLYIPAVVGFLLTGIIIGPHGLSLITGIQEVDVLAEIGVVLLLLTLGIEFSIKNLIRIGRSVIIGGSLQVFLTILVMGVLAKCTGMPPGKSIFFGFLFSLSSTAIILKLLQDRAEVDTPHGRIIIGILIYQDIIIVPMMLFTPILAGIGTDITGILFVSALKVLVVLALTFVLAKWILPKMLFYVARTRSRELFILSVVLICLSVAWLTHAAGLTLALGAFLAGLIISNSDYSFEALGNILPFKDVFTSFFFISVGMLLDVRFLLDNIGIVLLFVTLVVLFKSMIAGGAVLLMGFPVRVAVPVGLSLCQIGEFSFVLSKTGIENGLMSQGNYHLFLSVSILTMILSPFLVTVSPRLADMADKVPLPKILRKGFSPMTGPQDKTGYPSLRNHLIIIGFGVNGKNVARSAKEMGIPYVVIEMNPETVRSQRAKGEPIYYGDATRRAVLEHAGIQKAKVVVSVIHDAAATRRIVAAARMYNRFAYIIARTRFIQETIPLFDLGANEVIPEEFETSVEIFTRVLDRFNVPKAAINRFVDIVRSDGYRMFRSLSIDSDRFYGYTDFVPHADVRIFTVARGAPIAGKTLAQVDLRKKHGLTVLAIRRGNQTISNPDGDTLIAVHDSLVTLGDPEILSTAERLLFVPDSKKDER
ncbi:MAG: cation:proton antiporter [Deltaproteobacteria bacterium]|nr:cation:proton antiporter [Candidatus Zymogenaceae bacterium]